MAFTESNNAGALNGTTAVDIVAAPGASTRRLVRNINIYNADTAAVTVTVRYNANGSLYIICKITLQVGDTLVLDQDDLKVLDATTDKIQALMSGAAATTNPDYNTTYADVT